MDQQAQSPEDEYAAKVMAEVDDVILSTGLSQRETRFVMAYMTESTIFDAARAAGYTAETAKKNAPAWLDENHTLYKPAVAAAIRMKQEATAQAESLTVHELVKELKSVVYTDPLEFFDAETGSLLDIHQIPKSARMSIEEIEQTTVSVKPTQMMAPESGEIVDARKEVVKTKFKVRSKDGAIDKLLKVLGGYEKDNLQKAASYVVVPVPVPGMVQAGPVDPSAGRQRNIEDMRKTNNWIVEHGLEDPINVEE